MIDLLLRATGPRFVKLFLDNSMIRPSIDIDAKVQAAFEDWLRRFEESLE